MAMLHTILRFLGEDRYDEWEEDRTIESIHNYISDRDRIIRKGAISAHRDENVVIPLNMGQELLSVWGRVIKIIIGLLLMEREGYMVEKI